MLNRAKILLPLLLCLGLAVGAAPAATSDAPRVTGLNRGEDRVEGGAEVVLTGSNFTAAMTITIGDGEVDDLVVESATRARFRVPRQQAVGYRTLTVRTAAGIYQRPFEILPKPLAELAPGEITTVGGGVTFVGDGWDRSEDESILAPRQVAVDAARNVYIADTANHRIRRVDAVTGRINTVAGNGRLGFDGDGQPAESATLYYPYAVAVDRTGNLFVADTFNQRVRRVDAVTGRIATVIASAYPVDLALDAADNLYIAEAGPNQVRRIDAVTGVVSVVAGRGDCYEDTPPVDDGGLATEACINPLGICLDAAGNLFIADGYNRRVRRVDAATGILTTVAGRGQGRGFPYEEGPATEVDIDIPNDVVVAPDGTLYVVDGQEDVGEGLAVGFVRRVDPVTGWMSLRHLDTGIEYTTGLALDDAGNLYIADPDGGFVRVESSSSGLVANFAGSGHTGTFSWAGEGSRATSRPLGRVIDLVYDDGDLYVMSQLTYPGYWVSRIATASGLRYGDARGDGGGFVGGVRGHGFARDRHGNLYTSDGVFFEPALVHRFRAGTDTSKVLAGGGEQATVVGRKATRVYLPPPLRLECADRDVLYVSGNGVIGLDAKTGRILSFNPNVYGALAYANGDLYTLDQGYNVVRLRGRRETVVAGNGTFGTSGDGGPATLAGLHFVQDIAVDGDGNVYLMTDGRVRRVDAATGIIDTVAGGDAVGYTGDAGPASEAALDSPYRIAVGDGVVFVVCQTGVIRAFRPEE